jgi:lipopolysaccharide export system protein LptA
MRGRDIDLDYGQDGRSLQRVVLNGGASLEIAGGAGGGGQHLSGQHVEAGLAPDGATLTALLASGGVALDLLADASNPARTVRSGVLQASGAAGQGLTSAVFGEGVDFREAAARTTRTARSSTLTLALGHGLGRVESAQFAGDVAFVQGALTARSRDARYVVGKALLRLSGRDTKGRAPRVLDERVSIEADAIEVLLDQTRITASEAVKTELRADAGGGGTKAGAATRVPALLKADQPVRAAAGHLVYDGGTSVAAYSGGVDLWQDQFALAAEQVELDQRTGSLTADGRVVSRMRFERSGAATAAGDPPGSMTATSGLLRYDDDARRITYSGTARLNSRERDLSADTVELYLRSGARDIDRIEAEGAVSLLTGEGRKASGRRLVYESGKEQYDMTGAPATLDDDAGQTTGRSLIFFRSVDRIVVDGKEQTRTALRRGIKR